ncbi:MAG: hypothetical protein NTZ73_02740 [Candidatus Diapherotrites archaeon]|nr:hypothetical protein [Candidatus Diapherotrites archaeon]
MKPQRKRAPKKNSAPYSLEKAAELRKKLSELSRRADYKSQRLFLNRDRKLKLSILKQNASKMGDKEIDRLLDDINVSQKAGERMREMREKGVSPKEVFTEVVIAQIKNVISINSLVKRALRADKAYSIAISEYNKWLKVNPKNSVVRHRLGKALFEKYIELQKLQLEVTKLEEGQTFKTKRLAKNIAAAEKEVEGINIEVQKDEHLDGIKKVAMGRRALSKFGRLDVAKEIALMKQEMGLQKSFLNFVSKNREHFTNAEVNNILGQISRLKKTIDFVDEAFRKR